ncbi:MAG: hypothetical protein OXU45_05115 [Candidatus Melainabacteria bacterium]|nr:hypothetical protein [Candidatus Melainabacteria bacterium]
MPLSLEDLNKTRRIVNWPNAGDCIQHGAVQGNGAKNGKLATALAAERKFHPKKLRIEANIARLQQYQAREKVNAAEIIAVLDDALKPVAGSELSSQEQELIQESVLPVTTALQTKFEKLGLIDGSLAELEEIYQLIGASYKAIGQPAKAKALRNNAIDELKQLIGVEKKPAKCFMLLAKFLIQRKRSADSELIAKLLDDLERRFTKTTTGNHEKELLAEFTEMLLEYNISQNDFDAAWANLLKLRRKHAVSGHQADFARRIFAQELARTKPKIPRIELIETRKRELRLCQCKIETK